MPPDHCVRDPSLDCIGSQRVDMLMKELDEWKTDAKNDHEDIYNRIRKLELNDARRDEQYDKIIEKLDRLSDEIATATADLQAIKLKPAKRWDEATRQVLLAVVAAVCAFVLGRFGL